MYKSKVDPRSGDKALRPLITTRRHIKLETLRLMAELKFRMFQILMHKENLSLEVELKVSNCNYSGTCIGWPPFQAIKSGSQFKGGLTIRGQWYIIFMKQTPII